MDKPFVTRRLCAAAAAAAVVAGALWVPRERWVAFGRKLALTAVSWQQAQGAATEISARLQRQPAAAGSPENSPVEQTLPHEIETFTLPASPTPPPADGTGGKIVEQTVGGGEEIAGIRVKNRSGVAVDWQEALTAPLPYTVAFDTDEPQVLIYHTHTTEGYLSYDAGYYNAEDRRRALDYPYNVRVVGEALAAYLRAAGVAVVHDETVFDNPQYRGAYDRSAVMMEEMLQKYPSVKVTVDLHRDALMANDTDLLKPTAIVNGRKAAQMMVVCGVLSTEKLPHPHWRQNLAFAAQLQQTLENAYPGLMRPLSPVTLRYNQHLTPGSLLVEVGSEGNTLQEACTSAALLGEALLRLWRGEDL